MSQNATSPSAHLYLPTYRFCAETQAGLLQNNPLHNTKTVHAFAGYRTMVAVWGEATGRSLKGGVYSIF